MALLLVPDRIYSSKGWFDSLAVAEGWFDERFTARATGPVLFGSTSNDSGTASTSAVSITLPASIPAGAKILVYVGHSNAATYSGATSGFNQFCTSVNGTSETTTVFEKTATGGETTFAVTLSANAVWVVIARVWVPSGGGTVALDATFSTTTGNNVNQFTGSYTPTNFPGISEGFVSGRGAADGSAVTYTAPAGYSNLFQDTSTRTTPNRNAGIAVATLAVASGTIASAQFVASQSISGASGAVFLYEAASGGATVNATAGAMSLPSTSATVTGGARVDATAGGMALPSTSPTISAGATVTATAGAMALPSTSHAVTAGATVNATAGVMTLPSTNVNLDALVAATAAEMLLPSTSPFIGVSFPGSVTVIATAASMTLGATAPEITSTTAVYVSAASMLLGTTHPEAVLTGQPVRLMYLLGVGIVQDRERVKHPLWVHFAPPPLSKVVLLYRDGRVAEVEDPNYYEADAYVQNGNLIEEGSWQADVLLAAGYILVEAP